jgi:hypothetical protein
MKRLILSERSMVMTIAAASLVLASLAGEQTAAGTPPPIALVETFADGVTLFEIATVKPAWRWTPAFPRIEGFKAPDGQPPVADLKIARVLEGGHIKVTVSVLLGPARDEVVVDHAVITPGSRVVIDRLRAFGVEPVALSLATVAPFTPYPPIVSSVAPDVEVSRVDVHSAPYPGYAITLRNLSSKAISNLHFQSYHGEQTALSGLPRGENGAPLMTAGGSYTLVINLTSGSANLSTPSASWSPRPLDVIEIDSVRWADGTHSGQPPYPAIERVIERDGGLRMQITRVIDAFRETSQRPGSGAELMAALKQRVAALPDAEPNQLAAAQAAMRGFKAAVLGDIARFESGTQRSGVKNVREWLALTLERYEWWLSRLAA